MTANKQKALEKIEQLRPDFLSIAQTLFENPELGFEEYNSSRLLAEYMAGHGFEIRWGQGGLETAFTAAKGSGRPHVGIACEYDALPGLGHACGHNIIAAASVTAAVAAAEALETCGGTVILVGTPGEENKGGKKVLFEAGELDDLDCLMMFHPAPSTSISEPTLSIASYDYHFHGHGAHAAAMAHMGRSALDAAALMVANVNALRYSLASDEVVNGIITAGGVTTNVIPAEGATRFEVRASTGERRAALEKRIDACAQAAALATGCTVERTDFLPAYDEIWPSHVLVDLMEQNMLAAGEHVDQKYATRALASTDIGIVSHHIPTLHCTYASKTAAVPHTADFAKACTGDNADRMITGMARGLALTAVDLLEDPSLAVKAKEELSTRTGY